MLDVVRRDRPRVVETNASSTSRIAVRDRHPDAVVTPIDTDVARHDGYAQPSVSTSASRPSVAPPTSSALALNPARHDTRSCTISMPSARHAAIVSNVGIVGCRPVGNKLLASHAGELVRDEQLSVSPTSRGSVANVMGCRNFGITSAREQAQALEHVAPGRSTSAVLRMKLMPSTPTDSHR